jgi:hypothetical protein
VTVFVSATGQENIIFILERKSSKNLDKNINIFRINKRPDKQECLLSDCVLEKGFCENDQEYLECLCSRESSWNELFENQSLPLGKYISVFQSAKNTSDLKFNRSWDIFYPAEGVIREIMDSILMSCSNSVEKTDPLGNVYTEHDVVKYVKDFFVLRVGVLTTIDEIFILNPDKLKIQIDNYLLKLEISINMKRSKKQELVSKYIGKIDSEGYVWLELSEFEKQRLMDLYKTPSVYQHGLDISKKVGQLIFFEDETLYQKCPVLIKYLSQFKEGIIAKLDEYNELSPARPNKWITLRRSASITLPDRKKRTLFEYYHSKPKIFYNYRVGNNNIFGFTNKHMVAATDMYFFHKYGEKINTYYILAYLNSKVMTFYFKERPIALQRQKSNVENDIPIFLPRNEQELLLQKMIIKKEKKLVGKLQRYEEIYRIKGFHFDLNLASEEMIKIDLDTFLNKIDLPTIDDLSYRIKGELEIYTIDRRSFPILILNQFKIKKVGKFKEIVFGDDIHFQYKSLKIIVHQKLYEAVKLAIESYFNFSEKFNIVDLLQVKIPSQKIIEVIRIKKNQIFKKFALLIPEDKNAIESLIDNILLTQDINGERDINTVSKLLYFINLSFIKMMVPKYKDEILTY